MLKEEWRLQRSFVGSFGTGFFPLVIFFLALILVIIFPSERVSSSGILNFLHILIVLYGIMVGGLAYIGEHVMTRRLGEVNMVLSISKLQPVSFKKVMAVFYIKEIIFYYLYSILPIWLGFMAGSLIMGTDMLGGPLLLATLSLVFLIGLSLSFVVSGLSVRSRSLGIISGAAVLLTASLAWPIGIISIGQLLHPLGFWEDMDPVFILLSAAEFTVLSIFGVVLSVGSHTMPTGRYESRLLDIERYFGVVGRKRTALLAKEWLELRRSGTLVPVLLGFIGPLIAVYGMLILFRSVFDADIDFNVVFFGALVGFFGVMTYSWLNNVETNNFLNVQPVSVPGIIGIKLSLYFTITTVLTTLYVVGIGLINGDMHLFPLALLVAFSTNVYVAMVTAWLTGLRTNTMLLNGIVLSKFSLFVVPPLIALVIGSFYIQEEPVTGPLLLTAISLTMIGISLLLYERISKRWRGAVFGL